MRTAEAIIAANRFGLGARPEDVAAIEADPKGWLIRQIEGPHRLPQAFAGMPGGPARGGAFIQARLQKNEQGRREIREMIREESTARILAALQSPEPFRERLVAFWSNHFTVSSIRPVVAPIAGAFEREAIRPYVTGRFADMVLAVCRHPAMLSYLDNAASIGPESRAGARSKRGLNENLAREVMELHTVGIAAGYSQDDVRSLAKMLTGWRLVRQSEKGALGTFVFDDRSHEPGAQALMGKDFSAGGEAQAEAALRYLALHPATAKHVALKLARHFTTDEPPPAMVERLARRFIETEGDLAQVSRALVDSPEPWTQMAPKIRTPFDLQIAAFRALGIDKQPEKILPGLAEMGQPLFRAPSPAGWSDEGRDWSSPESMVKRVDWAVELAEKTRGDDAPTDVLERALGPVAGDATRQAVSRAESAKQAFALLFASPEFQRR
jgi:uncharacterized protein (DUF1800 family)